ncbi:hypothetical protein ABZY94_000614 [Listeria monocytogenes]
MDGIYKEFIREDSCNSLTFADGLQVSENEYMIVEQWFLDYLIRHEKSEPMDLNYENEMREQHSEILPFIGENAKKYMIGKLLVYYNISSGGYLRSSYIARLTTLLRNLLSDYIKIEGTQFTPIEFELLTQYTKKISEVSPNGDILENLLKIEKLSRICATSNKEQRNQILLNLLSIIKKKSFHHDIQCYKKILTLIRQEDEVLISYLKRFKVNNNQGCYLGINTVMKACISQDMWTDFTIKKKLISLLDSAKGKCPKESWIKKLHDIHANKHSDEILLLCNELFDFEKITNYVFQNGHYWSDDVLKRFIKGGHWIVASV